LLAQSDLALRTALPDSEAQGVGFLEEAVRLQPDNPHVWGKLALAGTYVAEHAAPDKRAARVAAVQESARRALHLEPLQVDAHAALAILPPYFGDWLAAERRMAAVLRIDPEHLPTRDARDFMLVAAGRAREGAANRVITAAREPLHAGQQFKLVYANWILGRIAAADQASDRALQLWPKHPGVWFSRLWTLAFTGRAERALAHVEDAGARPDLPPPMVAALRIAMAALASRRPADVSRAVAAVTGLFSHGPGAAVNAVMMLTGLGEIDRAFDVARAYLLEQGPLMASVRWRPGQISVNDQRRRKTNMLFVPVAAPLRADPRFLELTQQIGLAQYWRAAGVVPDFLQRG
jgi:tetratricopeptide (TPR) repeat protein